MLEHPGPTYLRASRGKVPVILDPNTYRFEPGKAVQVRDGSEVTVITCGIMLARTLEAAEELAVEDI